MKFFVLSLFFGVASAQSQSQCALFDANGSGQIDIQDLLALLSYFNVDCGTTGGGGGGASCMDDNTLGALLNQACDYAPTYYKYHWEMPDPNGDCTAEASSCPTGMLGWTVVGDEAVCDGNQDCSLVPEWVAEGSITGLSSNHGHCWDHELGSGLITRSPPFWGPLRANLMTANGVGSETNLCGDGTTLGVDCTDQTINAQFAGFAIRRVSDGVYVNFETASCDLSISCAGAFEPVSFMTTGEAGEQYTIDIIDNYFGTWGWMVVNDVEIHQGYPGHVNMFYADTSLASDSVEEFGGPDNPDNPIAAPEFGPGGVSSGSSDLELMHDTIQQTVCVRFPSVDIPQGADLAAAWGLFTVDEPENPQQRRPLAVKIQGELNANSAPMNLEDYSCSSRQKTAAQVIWGPMPMTTEFEDLMTDDISEIVEEIVALPDWQAGNPITLVFNYVAGPGIRWVETSLSSSERARINRDPDLNTPSLKWSYDPCLAQYAEPCVDDYEGFLSQAGYNCDKMIRVYCDGPACEAERCAGGTWHPASWSMGAYHSSFVNGVLVRNELPDEPMSHFCPVMCGVCEQTAHDQAIASVMPLFNTCYGRMSFEAFFGTCCAGARAENECAPLVPNGDSGEIWGVPTDYNVTVDLDSITDQSSCSIECSWIIVPLWEACGEIIWQNSLQIERTAPSDPTMMRTYYDTCKPVFDANPPPPPVNLDGNFWAPVYEEVSGRVDGSEENVATGVIDHTSSDYELACEGDCASREQQILIVFGNCEADTPVEGCVDGVPLGPDSTNPIALGTTTEDFRSIQIMFVVDEDRCGSDQTGRSCTDTTLRIYGEANANPAVPASGEGTNGDVTARTKTSAFVDWQPAAHGTDVGIPVGSVVYTPDLTPIVDEIMGLSGYQRGNRMAFIITLQSAVETSGSRWMESFQAVDQPGNVANGVYTPALVMMPGCIVTPPTIYSLSGRVDGSEERMTTGVIDHTSSDYELVHEGDSPDRLQQVLLVFGNCDDQTTLEDCVPGIPADVWSPGVDIKIMFVVDEVRSSGTSGADVTLRIFGEASASPSLPASGEGTNGDVSSRVRTSAYVEWAPEPHTDASQVGSLLFTPDISPILDELVNTVGWSGPLLSLLIENGSGSGSRWVESFQAVDIPGSPYHGVATPALVVTAPRRGPPATVVSVSGRVDGSEEKMNTGIIDHTSSDYELVHEGDSPTDLQQIVIVFGNCDDDTVLESCIPGVPISSDFSADAEVKIMFIVDEVRTPSSWDVTINIYGEASVEPSLPLSGSGTAGDVSSRTRTSAFVAWTPETQTDSSLVGSLMYTPDLQPIVSEIVAMDGWDASTHKMSFLFELGSGSGSRWVESFQAVDVPGHIHNGVYTPALLITDFTC